MHANTPPSRRIIESDRSASALHKSNGPCDDIRSPAKNPEKRMSQANTNHVRLPRPETFSSNALQQRLHTSVAPNKTEPTSPTSSPIRKAPVKHKQRGAEAPNQASTSSHLPLGREEQCVRNRAAQLGRDHKSAVNFSVSLRELANANSLRFSAFFIKPLQQYSPLPHSFSRSNAVV